LAYLDRRQGLKTFIFRIIEKNPVIFVLNGKIFSLEPTVRNASEPFWNVKLRQRQKNLRKLTGEQKNM
jgi:hypothetical protein